MGHPSKTIEAMFLPSGFLFLILLMSGTPTSTAAALGVQIAVQISGGTALWFALNGFRPLKAPIAIGMGIAMGTSISTLCQLVFRNTLIGNFFWAIPLLFVLLLSKKRDHQVKINQLNLELSPAPKELNFIFSIFGFSCLAMASIWWWLYPFAVGVFGFQLSAIQRFKKGNSRFLLRPLTAIVILSGFIVSLKLRGINDFWKVTSNDQVFSESLSWSILQWGSSDSPFASGTPINYHWFALLWAGASSSSVNAEPWTVVTRVLPVISFIGVFSLLWGLTEDFFKRTSAPFIACTFLVLYSNNLGLSLTRTIASPTFLLACVWLLAFTHSIFSFWKNPSWQLIFSSSVFLFMAFGGKVMNGAIGLSAALFALGIAFIARQTNVSKRFLLMMATMLIASFFLVYFLVYRNNQPGNLNYLLIESLLAVQLGLLTRDKGSVFRLISNIFITSAMMLPMIAILVYAIKQTFRKEFRFWFVSGSIVASFILTFMTSHPGASQLYFWLASMVLTAILIPTVFYDGFTPSKEGFSLAPYWVICSISAFFSIYVWNRAVITESGFSSLILKYASVASGFILILLLSAVVKFGLNKFSKSNVRFLHVAFLGVSVLFNLGLGVNQRITNLVDRSQVKMSDATDKDLMTGSIDHLEILDWIRLNTDVADIVATNRFCIPGPSYCISKWQLVSAVSHRRMLFEGGYFELPIIPGLELYNRYLLSSKFGNNPSPLGLRKMCDYGVRWYFYDHSVSQPLKTWEPYAEISIQNETVSLLRLRCPTN
jgi:hypothetical protein